MIPRHELAGGIVTLRDNARRRLCDAEGEAIVNVWKTWSWTTAINQVDASAFEDWLVSTPTTGYSGSTHSVLKGYSRGTPQYSQRTRGALHGLRARRRGRRGPTRA